ncbi:hypothetical protein [Roseobacter sp. HKCCA0434]|uniref:hypothetical protein n=1 Tax=Roseobacter sp. HKCCA0434 TaxID=3079297 RepID=UPI002905C0DC|nr:hypothetical protein [Roseobacter sp. HKCCA0434]
MGGKDLPSGNLHIDPDEDVDLIELLEKRLNIRFSEKDLASAFTLGDLYDPICRHLPPSGRGDKAQMVKSRLADASISSDGDVLNLDAGSYSAKKLRRRLEDRTGLSLPFLTKPSLWATLTALLPLVAWIVGPVCFDGLTAAVVAVASTGLGILLWRFALRIDPEVWDGPSSLAALIAKAVEANFGRLVASGASWSEREVWEVLAASAAEFTNVPPEEMRRDTSLM